MWLARFSSSTAYRTLQQQTADVVNQRRTPRSWFFVCLIQPDGTEPLLLFDRVPHLRELIGPHLHARLVTF